MRIRNGKIHVLYASNRVEIHPFIWKVRVQLIITQSCKKISLPRQRIIAHGQRDRWKGRKGGGGRKERRIAASFFHRLLRRKRKRGANKRGTYPRGKWVTMQIVGRNLCAHNDASLARARAHTLTRGVAENTRWNNDSFACAPPSSGFPPRGGIVE